MGAWVRVARIGDLAEGQARVVTAGSLPIALCNVGGVYHAIADLCSHDNGPLGEGELFEDQIECPRHGARFDVKTGRPLTLPAVVPVPVYPVRVNGQEIEVEIPEEGEND